MIRRWIIRGLVWLLLALCVVAWVGSYWRRYELCHTGRFRYVTLVVDYGEVLVEVVSLSDWQPSHPGWSWTHLDRKSPGVVQLIDDPWGGGSGYPSSDYHFIGFALSPSFGARHTWDVWVPFWFLTLLPARFMWRTWRKKRGQPPGAASPVEMTAIASGGKAGMIRRGLIRGPALTLLTLCVAAWVFFSWAGASVAYNTGHRVYEMNVGEGRLWLVRPNWALAYKGWNVRFFAHISDYRWGNWRDWQSVAGAHVAGFSWGSDVKAAWVSMPLWFLSATAAGLFWMVWRGTKPKVLTTRGAFPVEPAKAGDKQP